MFDDNCNTITMRRDFLKQTLFTTGYMLPVVAAIQFSSLDAWVKNHPFSNRNNPNNQDSRDKRKPEDH